MSLILTAFCALACLVWAVLLAANWRHQDARHNGRPLRMVLWAMALTSCVASVLTSFHQVSAADAVYAFGGVVFPGLLLAGGFGSLWAKGRSSYPVVPMALLFFSVVLLISAAANGQIGVITWLVTTGLLYLPGLVLVLWRTTAPLEVIRGVARRICLFVVWASLAFAVVDLPHAMGDLPRRFPVGQLQFRLAGVTPHPNLLAFTTAIAVFLTLKTKTRLRIPHLLACGAILVLAEARTLTIGLIIGLLAYWIVSTRGSRLVRAIGTAIFAGPVAVAFWPTIMESFDDSSLGADVSTFNSRTLVWNLVGQYWTDRPLFGWGPFAFNDRTMSPISSLFFDHAHNQLLESLVEGGLLGLAAMLIVVVRLGWSVLHSRDAPYVAITAMTLLFMMTEVPLTLHAYGFSFAVVLGSLLLAILVPGPIEVPKPEPRAKRFKVNPHFARIEEQILMQERRHAKHAALLPHGHALGTTQ